MYGLVLNGRSPSGYQFIHQSGILSLPTLATLRNYTGPSTAQTGMPPLIRKRLEVEFTTLDPMSRFVTLQFDEMNVFDKHNLRLRPR